jgi:glycosyltransferase involved in cell wall biosynthesis
MRVLHAPVNMAGQATIISESLQNLGVESDVLVFNKHPFGYEGEKSLSLKNRLWIGEKISILIYNFIRCTIIYDVFHFHFGLSLLPRNIDLPILNLLRKKTVMHYWGDDIRQNDIAVKYTCLSREDLAEVYTQRVDDAQRQKVRKLNKYIDASIVGDYSLLSYAPKSIVIKQAIDLSRWDYVGAGGKRVLIKIVHAPSNQRIKGTKYILSAIRRLKDEGKEIDFILLENMSNQQVRDHCKDADIVIDQLLLESYGIFAIECMALGKPVLCRIDDHFIKYYSDIPIVVTDPETLYDNLKMLIQDPKLRQDLGEKGRRFVEKVHDSREIARQLIDLYKSL